MLRRKLDEYCQSVVERFKKEGSIINRYYPYANFFGQESAGLKQIRGNGTLVLTDKALYFALWKPKREYNILLNEIIGIEKTKSHLKKTKGIMMLKVIFIKDKGEQDSIAWIVDKLDDWISIIKDNMKRYV